MNPIKHGEPIVPVSRHGDPINDRNSQNVLKKANGHLRQGKVGLGKGARGRGNSRTGLGDADL
eukprot:4298602-Prymnesium_polylepis.1